jgi:uroporphyrin-III C-methyltransferase
MPTELGRGKAGRVYLVGAGPGDPGLLTVRARDLLGSCDSVLHDHLVTHEILAFVRPGAELVAVGKVGHGSQVAQDEIHRLLVARARSGQCVVRLQGGCPTLFGRAGEEALALREAGVGFEIVPGVTSALAVPAYAGIPVTHRGLASSVAIVAGHCAGSSTRSLGSLAHADTLVILMGVRSLPQIATELLAAGRDPDTPAALIQEGTSAGQRVVRATLATLAAKVRHEGVGAPAVIVVGEVVGLQEQIDWHSSPTCSNNYVA